MKHFRIIETGVSFPDVLVKRNRKEADNEVVEIFAIGKQEDCEDLIFFEDVIFNNSEAAISFIENFNKKQAEDFCVRNNAEYW